MALFLGHEKGGKCLLANYGGCWVGLAVCIYPTSEITGRIAEMADRFPEIHRPQFSFGRYCSLL